MWERPLNGLTEYQLEFIRGFVARRPKSFCYRFAYPEATGWQNLPGMPPRTAFSTQLGVLKGLHTHYNLGLHTAAPGRYSSVKFWITATLQYVDKEGEVVGDWGTCHLYGDGRESRGIGRGEYIHTWMPVRICISKLS